MTDSQRDRCEQVEALLAEFVQWFGEHDGKADDWGELALVANARELLGMERQPQRELRWYVQAAHRSVQAAQGVAYSPRSGRVPMLTRLALNRAQNTLIKLIVHGKV